MIIQSVLSSYLKALTVVEWATLSASLAIVNYIGRYVVIQDLIQVSKDCKNDSYYEVDESD